MPWPIGKADGAVGVATVAADEELMDQPGGGVRLVVGVGSF
jgi:hypothetical protein